MLNIRQLITLKSTNSIQNGDTFNYSFASGVVADFDITVTIGEVSGSVKLEVTPFDEGMLLNGEPEGTYDIISGPNSESIIHLSFPKDLTDTNLSEVYSLSLTKAGDEDAINQIALHSYSPRFEPVEVDALPGSDFLIIPSDIASGSIIATIKTESFSQSGTYHLYCGEQQFTGDHLSSENVTVNIVSAFPNKTSGPMEIYYDMFDPSGNLTCGMPRRIYVKNGGTLEGNFTAPSIPAYDDDPDFQSINIKDVENGLDIIIPHQESVINNGDMIDIYFTQEFETDKVVNVGSATVVNNNKDTIITCSSTDLMGINGADCQFFYVLNGLPSTGKLAYIDTQAP